MQFSLYKYLASPFPSENQTAAGVEKQGMQL